MDSPNYGYVLVVDYDGSKIYNKRPGVAMAIKTPPNTILDSSLSFFVQLFLTDKFDISLNATSEVSFCKTHIIILSLRYTYNGISFLVDTISTRLSIVRYSI